MMTSEISDGIKENGCVNTVLNLKDIRKVIF